MKTLTLKTNSLVGLYMKFILCSYPNDICNLRKHVILSFILFPLWIIPALFTRFLNYVFDGHNYELKYHHNAWFSALFMFTGIISYVLMKDITTINLFEQLSVFNSFILVYFLGIIGLHVVAIGLLSIVFLECLIVIGGITASSKVTYKAITDMSYSNSVTITIRESYYSLKDKYCSKINWK